MKKIYISICSIFVCDEDSFVEDEFCEEEIVNIYIEDNVFYIRIDNSLLGYSLDDYKIIATELADIEYQKPKVKVHPVCKYYISDNDGLEYYVVGDYYIGKYLW